jgi:hypothetical protein
MTISLISFVPIIIIVIVSIILFRWQENKHQFEISLFFTFEQLQHRMVVPKRDMLDSVLFFFVGVTLLEFGSISLWSTMRVYNDLGTFSEGTKNIVEQSLRHIFIFGPVMIGIGAALAILGVRSVIANKRYKHHLQNISQ